MLRMMAILAAAAPLLAVPAAAQNAPVNGVRVIYGNDPCPPDEICVTAPESERFRIPKDIREQEKTARQNESWAVRQQGALEAGKTGTGSCSAVGAGGTTGCSAMEAKAWKAEMKARKQEEASLPLP
ncbi:MAG: hypothetical protein WDN24_19765 [Sphingomonas sp.]